MAKHLDLQKEAFFPRLNRNEYEVTSDETAGYNCIAHAAGCDDMPWWPLDATGVHWPDGVDKEETIDCFIQAYETCGYVVCDNSEAEENFEKVALYIGLNGEPTHAARQLPNGSWTSKLGEWEDIEHKTLRSLEDADISKGLGYGRVAVVMKRPKP